MSLARRIVYCGQPAVVVCDAKCSKAWGLNSRPQIDLSDDPDDFAFLADGELGDAPDDPGTYEGGHAKPLSADQRLNKWCVRQCERSAMSLPASDTAEAPDMSIRSYNQPWKHTGQPTPTATHPGADR